MSRRWAVAVTLAFVACGEDPAPFAVRSTRVAVVGGALDDGDPAVVALTADTLVLCTGTVIGPHTVLTAGHCAAPLGPGVPYFASFGSDASQPTSRIKLGRQVLHPSYAGEGKPFDLAVVELTRPTDVVPIALTRVALGAGDVGRVLRHVGFGVSNETTMEGRGIKRQVSYPLNKIDPEQLWSGAPGKQTCNGDSGGPALISSLDGGEEIVAVVSDGPSCHEDGADARADTTGAWIEATMRSWEPTADAGSDPPKRSGCSAVPGTLSAVLALFVLALAGRRQRCPGGSQERRQIFPL